jgi:catechol 2,3-dioxygenase-like lactoylglutathione lyase family enzyme
MSTIDHATIRVTELAEATAFYNRVFDLLGYRHEGEAFLRVGRLLDRRGSLWPSRDDGAPH